jgi:hypothetical protein
MRVKVTRSAVSASTDALAGNRDRNKSKACRGQEHRGTTCTSPFFVPETRAFRFGIQEVRVRLPLAPPCYFRGLCVAIPRLRTRSPRLGLQWGFRTAPTESLRDHRREGAAGRVSNCSWKAGLARLFDRNTLPRGLDLTAVRPPRSSAAGEASRRRAIPETGTPGCIV